MSHGKILEQFIATFTILNSPLIFNGESTSFPHELQDGVDDSPWARQKWKPAQMSTPICKLQEIYMALPTHFPPLYEKLILAYRWLDVELGGLITLLPNPPAPDFKPLLYAMTSDPGLVPILFRHGLLPFGKQPGGGYDPICFDTTHRQPDGDCPIVRLEHEEILCNQKIGKMWRVADSFQKLVETVISMPHL